MFEKKLQNMRNSEGWTKLNVESDKKSVLLYLGLLYVAIWKGKKINSEFM